jgi:hypothetical protein
VKLRELVESALPLATDRPEPAAGLAEGGARAAAPGRCARRSAPTSLARRSRGRQAETGIRRAARSPAALARRAAEREEQVAAALPGPGELIERYRAVLPFDLTEHQEGAIAEIDADLARTTPMQRLLQGDVGSGKTVVALYALLRAVEVGSPGRTDGAHRDARRAALPDDRGHLRGARGQLCARDRVGEVGRSAARPTWWSARTP